MTWCVYIVRCSDASLYTGITDDINRRIAQHNAGKGAKYTRGRGPVKLRYLVACASKAEALGLEIRIKRLRRYEKLALIQSVQR